MLLFPSCAYNFVCFKRIECVFCLIVSTFWHQVYCFGGRLLRASHFVGANNWVNFFHTEYGHWLLIFSLVDVIFSVQWVFCGLLTSCPALEMVQFCLTDGVSTWSGTIKGLTTSQLEDIGCQIILGNTYHLALRPTSELLDEVGGLHNFMNWPRALLTDSGGFQMVVYGFMYLYSCLPWLCMHFCDF